jgi:transcriptional regulator with XRE-family HTH domain
MSITEQQPQGGDIVSYRKQAGLARTRLSELSGVGVTTIIRLEQGVTRNPGLGTLARLARALSRFLDEPEGNILGALKQRYLSFQPPEHSLRDYRQQAGMTQEELAEAVGVSVGTISTFERQVIDTIFLSTALRIARCLAERLPEVSAKDILYHIAAAVETESR